MKNHFTTTIGVTLLAVILPFQCSNKLPAQEGLALYLPDLNHLPGWKTVGEPQHAEGESLFELINGGAEIYNEYGFHRAIFHSYGNKNDKSINLEMYEMEDPASAFGAYTFKISQRGQEVPLGNGGMLEDYYLNFWKGNLLVTLIGFDTDQETRDGIMAMAKSIDAKIEGQGVPPIMVNYLVEENLKKSIIKYLQGNLGLFNHYQFDTKNIFGLKEGVIGRYDDFEIFIFRYDDADESRKWFKEAQSHLKPHSAFSKYVQHKDGFSMIDAKDRYIFIKSYRNNILVYLGAKETFSRGVLEKIQGRIDSH